MYHYVPNVPDLTAMLDAVTESIAFWRWARIYGNAPQWWYDDVLSACEHDAMDIIASVEVTANGQYILENFNKMECVHMVSVATLNSIYGGA